MKKLFYDMPPHLFNPLWPELISNEMNWRPSTPAFSPPSIKVPFPPPITAQDIALKRPISKICSKSPNAFFIYRKAYFDQLARLNRRFKMTDVSKLVSLNWKKERREVKEAYKKIAREVESELNERRKRDLVYHDIDPNLKVARRKNTVHRKKCGKVTTYDRNGGATFKRGDAVNQQGGTRFELTFGSDMQPLIHPYDVGFENYFTPADDAVSSSSDEPIAVATETNDETILDQNDADDNVLDPIPAQSQNGQFHVENDANSDLLNAQNVAFDEFCFDDNTNLNWYLQNFV